MLRSKFLKAMNSVMKTHETTFLRLRVKELEEQLLTKEKLIAAWEKANGKHYPQYLKPLIKELFDKE